MKDFHGPEQTVHGRSVWRPGIGIASRNADNTQSERSGRTRVSNVRRERIIVLAITEEFTKACLKVDDDGPWQFLIASTVGQCVSLMHSHFSASCILLEWDEETSGVDLFIGRVRSQLRFSEVPLVVCRREVSPEFIRMASGLGIHGIVALPVTPESLQLKLTEVIDQVRPRVLVVHTAAILRKMLAEAVSRAKCVSLTCERGLTALERIRNERIDVVLSQVILPDSSGWELLVSAKEINVNVAILLVAETEQEQEKIMASGADGFIRHPISSLQVARKIRESVERTRIRNVRK